MDLDLSPDQEFFRETTRKFLEATVPIGTLRTREGAPEAFERDWWRQGAELGWTSLLVPEELGGGSLSGEGLLDLVLVAEEMGRVAAPGPLVPVNVVAETLSRSGSDEQQSLIADLVGGQTVAAWAIHEPGGGWDGDSVSLRATRAGGDFVLDGTKVLVESGNQADRLLVTPRADEGLTQFLVEVGSTPLVVEPETSLDLGRHYATVRFEGTPVSASSIVGTLGAAGDDVRRQLRTAAAVQLAETTGVAARVFELTLEYMGDRYSFGRALMSYQALKHRVADMKMWLEASLGVATAAARAVQDDADDADAVVSAAKSYAGEKATDLIQDAVQLHGGIGVTWEHDLHLYLRRATVNRFTYGTPEAHRERLAGCGGM